jgi:uncharacterized caspase-like protein
MIRSVLMAMALVLAPMSSAAAQTRSLAADKGASVAVIIGNESYRYAERFSVDYAVNDANAIKDYLVRFLGFAERNIIFEKRPLTPT